MRILNPVNRDIIIGFILVLLILPFIPIILAIFYFSPYIKYLVTSGISGIKFSIKFFISLLERKTVQYLVVFFVLSISLYLYTKHNFGYTHDLIIGIIAEVHGLLFDILIVGFLFVAFDSIYDKKRERERILSEIEELRFLKTEESSIRLSFLIRRLTKLKPRRMVNLSGSNLNNANLRNLELWNFSFEKCSLQNTNFSNSVFNKVSFAGANCINTDFINCKLNDTNFLSSTLDSCDFTFATFSWDMIKHSRIIIKNQFANANNIPTFLATDNITKNELLEKLVEFVNSSNVEISFPKNVFSTKIYLDKSTDYTSYILSSSKFIRELIGKFNLTNRSYYTFENLAFIQTKFQTSNNQKYKMFTLGELYIVLKEELNYQEAIEFKICPFCAEKIMLKAKICKYCGRDQEI